MAYVKLTTMAKAEAERLQAETEDDIALALATVEDELDLLTRRHEHLVAMLTDLQVRVAKLEANPREGIVTGAEPSG